MRTVASKNKASSTLTLLPHYFTTKFRNFTVKAQSLIKDHMFGLYAATVQGLVWLEGTIFLSCRHILPGFDDQH
jgi:hypothetical protein